MIQIVYAYVAYNESREIVKGKLEAKSEEQAASLLNYAGYQLINLRVLNNFPTLEKLFARISPVKSSDIILFYRQMALLIESGLNMVTAIELLEEQCSNRIFKKVMAEVIDDVRGGSQLSVSMSKHPQIFSSIHCQSLKVGEQTGGMELILRQIADHLEKQVNAGKGIKNAMTYPIIASIVALIVVAIMVVFVLPAFSSLYVSLGAELPFLTRMMLSTGDYLREYGLYFLAAIFIFTTAGLVYTRTTQGRYNWDKLAIRFPVVGRINHLNELARICRSISVLYKAGSSLTEIMPLVIQSSSNKVMIRSLMEIRDDMLGGEGLSRPMSKHPIFLPMMVQMVRVGEETGNLDNTLVSVAQSYETEAEDKTRALIGMIQPVMTIAIGLVVGLMALSLVTAMYSMYGQS
ncbi:MAG: type II secretion system F family protein [Dehalococcoidales bacterium]|nr:type II secretion system F family protein [Dehalococcoidales bacterium]